MELFAEEEQKMKPKPKKTIKPTTILLVLIIILSILTVVILCLLVYVKGNILTISLNGLPNEQLKQVLTVNEGNVEIPIKKLASYLGYEAHSGDYKTLSVDSSKSYVESKEQVTMFTANSKIIEQILLESNTTQQLVIDEEVIEKDGEFYTTIDGAKKIFSIYFDYNSKKNDIAIMTLDYLYENYLNYYVQKGFLQIEEIFQNKKAVLENLMILKDDNEKYGVIDIQTGEMLIENQYDEIKYLPSLNNFIVTGNKLKGIISKDKEMILQLQYKDINIIENNKDKNSYYLVTTNNNLMGLIDTTGKVIIYPEYNQIGIDANDFDNNDIDNEYILFGRIIPVEQNNLWAIFDIQGKQITEFKYTNLGSITKLANTYNVIQIPEFELIVVGTESGKYNIITADGNELFDNIIDSVYKAVISGQNYYYVVANDRTVDLMPYLEQNGIKRVK